MTGCKARGAALQQQVHPAAWLRLQPPLCKETHPSSQQGWKIPVVHQENRHRAILSLSVQAEGTPARSAQAVIARCHVKVRLTW